MYWVQKDASEAKAGISVVPGANRFQIGTRPVRFTFFFLCNFPRNSELLIMGCANLGSSVVLESIPFETELESEPEVRCLVRVTVERRP